MFAARFEPTHGWAVEEQSKPNWAFSWKDYVLGDNMIAVTVQMIAAALLFAIVGGTVSWLLRH